MPAASPRHNRYRKILIPAIVLLILGGFLWRYDADHPAPGALPALSLESLAGHTVMLGKLNGKPLIINLWATWCPPCRAELPLLMKASHQYPNMQFYFAEQGDSRANVKAYAEKIGLTPAHILLDTNTRLSKFFGVLGYPTTIFYNAAGNIVAIHRGELTSSTLKQYLARLGHNAE
ncbi:hypothetical protein BI364_15225 [Acidihalobacter yilgarnensis]|uniref:Thioredoxin domain-containing protein n=1 Tax=Acidihalobacter yilgarnensis TaxID=2819280 RepID=A0A1D8IRJ3_9GAMM|nr:TlpA disulfide reductase family protein [Acidihalobacter yilgarnensis]AOU99111.1 hypothetical protein BI364_15225 [Acidihalobacter yilgarnensis]